MSIENENKVENAEAMQQQEPTASTEAAEKEHVEYLEADVVDIPDGDDTEDEAAEESNEHLEADIADYPDEKTDDEDNDEYSEDSEEGSEVHEETVSVLSGKIVHDNADKHMFAITYEQQHKADWEKVITGMKRKTVYERRIVSVEPAGNGLPFPRLVVMLYDFPVYISTHEYFEGSILPKKDLSAMETKERNVLEYSLAAKLVDSFVIFTIEDAQHVYDKENGYTVYAISGSHKEALERKLYKNYFSPNRKIRVGNIVDARVVLPRKRGVFVTVGGKEILVPYTELSVSKWVDPIKDFPTGTLMQVVVTGLEVDRKNKTIALSVSRRTMDEAYTRSKYDHLRIGTRTVGTVVAVMSDKNYALVNLDVGVRAIAKLYGLNGAMLNAGDRVTFSVAKKRDDKIFCYGNCLPINARII